MTHYTVTPEHLKRELELAEYLSKKWKCCVQHQYKYSIYDCVAHRNHEPKAFVEMRVVNYAADDLPEIMIPMSKIMDGQQQTNLTKIPSFFVVYWYKCKTVKFVDVNNIECIPKFRVTKMNMNRTNKPKEVEVARFVPKEVFTYVGQNTI